MPSASPARTPATMILADLRQCDNMAADFARASDQPAPAPIVDDWIIAALAALDAGTHQAHTLPAAHTPAVALQGASSEAAGFVSSRRPLFEGEA